MKHEDYTEMLALAALDALDEGGRRTLEAHLAECADCRAELNALRDAAASLVYAASPVTPAAPELRARILARIKLQAQDVSREPFNGAVTSPATSTSSTSSNVRSLDEFAKRREARGVTVSRRVFV
ncbi:MAG: zf-HC2 domain-containing protein, partial [Acidobacteria bacterium]|nr:zf-HC2 domain-containing protein [Acidobacteriota bacterium]